MYEEEKVHVWSPIDKIEVGERWEPERDWYTTCDESVEEIGELQYTEQKNNKCIRY